MNQIVSVAILVLVMSVLFGLTFLFISELKDNVRDNAEITLTITNETELHVNKTADTLSVSTDDLARSYTIVEIWGSYNQSDGDDSSINNLPAGYNVSIGTANVSVTDAGVITNTTDEAFPNVSITYTYKSASEVTSYTAVNDTEVAGATVIDYLPLVFLSLIFGALLMVVLKVILPYINLGKQVSKGF